MDDLLLIALFDEFLEMTVGPSRTNGQPLFAQVPKISPIQRELDRASLAPKQGAHHAISHWGCLVPSLDGGGQDHVGLGRGSDQSLGCRKGCQEREHASKSILNVPKTTERPNRHSWPVVETGLPGEGESRTNE